MAWAHRFSTYPLTDEAGRLAGLVTLNRIRALAPERRATSRLRDIACPADQVPTARADEPLAELLPRMSGCADGRAAVVDGQGTVVGIVSPSDVMRAIQLASLRTAQPGPGKRAR
jgi:CBS-domain-containing membrane protein